jgi:DNA-binding response OmpR family regulator
MNYEFKIVVFTEDSEFAISLATECNKYGFLLSFIENIEDILSEINNETILVSLIDLNDKNYDGMNLCKKIKNEYNFPVFGVLNMFDKKIQDQAKDSGYDLIFTKKMLLKSIREVVIHVSKE